MDSGRLMSRTRRRSAGTFARHGGLVPAKGRLRLRELRASRAVFQASDDGFLGLVVRRAFAGPRGHTATFNEENGGIPRPSN